ncbi:MAG: hypothetical protein ACFFCW_47910, partial [Candidatus Hodarchaeota archaeon]
GNYPPTLGTYSVQTEELPSWLAAKLVEKNEIDKDRIYLQAGIENVRNRPAVFIKMMIRKFFQFWFNLGYLETPSKATLLLLAIHVSLMSFAVSGFIKGGHLLRKRVSLILIFLVYFTLLHMLISARVRYSIPMMPLVIVLSSQGILSLQSKIRYLVSNLKMQRSLRIA